MAGFRPSGHRGRLGRDVIARSAAPAQAVQTNSPALQGRDTAETDVGESGQRSFRLGLLCRQRFQVRRAASV